MDDGRWITANGAVVNLLCYSIHHAHHPPSTPRGICGKKLQRSSFHDSTARREAPWATHCNPDGAPLQPWQRFSATPMELLRPRGASLQLRRHIIAAL